MRPYILISNDDGYQARGINYLIETLRPMADLLVIAPEGPRSGFAAAITTQVHMTLRTIRQEDGLTVMACSGSPVDCVKMAFNIVLPRLHGTAPDGYTPLRKPDLVIGGINHGDNSSVNTYYSGTMGVVTEGTFQGVPSIGFSLCDLHADADFSACGEWIERLVSLVLDKGLPPFTCLNVNFPHISQAVAVHHFDPEIDNDGIFAGDGETVTEKSCDAAAEKGVTAAEKGVTAAEGGVGTDKKGEPVAEGGDRAVRYAGARWCRMAKSTWIREVEEAQRPKHGQTIYWLTGDPLELEPEATDTDRWALAHGYVSIVPQTLDCTAYDVLDAWQTLLADPRGEGRE